MLNKYFLLTFNPMHVAMHQIEFQNQPFPMLDVCLGTLPISITWYRALTQLLCVCLQVLVQETEEEKSEDQEVKDFFASIAGEDLEVDCFELQEILDFALKKGTNYILIYIYLHGNKIVFVLGMWFYA